LHRPDRLRAARDHADHLARRLTGCIALTGCAPLEITRIILRAT
jgi:hypothetical protein